MKRLSRLTALLLALVLMLSSGLSAVAESIATKEQYFAAARRALQRMINGSETYSDYWDIVDIIKNEDFAEFIDSLESEEFKEMARHVEDLFWDSCVTYDNVAPFLAPVNYEAYKKSKSKAFTVLAKADGDADTLDNALFLSKNAVPNDDGTYKIKLESFVTGTVQAQKTVVPCDIVLVLDFSGSMKQVEDGTNTRRELLRDAVNEFIDATAAKFNAEGSDHRMAIVSYHGTATTQNDWTYVTDSTFAINENKNCIGDDDGDGTANINDLKITGTRTGSANNDNSYSGELKSWSGSGTNPGDGMLHAMSLLDETASYEGKYTTREKVVILFTDGMPSSNGNGVNAINNAKTLKDDGVTVYSIAMMSGADPNKDVDTWSGFSFTGNGTTGVNAFMHAVSSNYPDATAEEVESSSGGGGGWPNWGWSNNTVTITPGTKEKNGYYLSTGSEESLSVIFNKISENIDAGASMDLGSTTVVKDIVTPQFVLPANTTNFKIETAECESYNEITHVATWLDAVEVTDGSITATPNATTNTLKVTGFDYSANYVSQNPYNRLDPDATTGRDYNGSKLIISFDVPAKPDFLGGLDVDTNTEAAVETTDGVKIELYTKPVVDVPLKTITPVVEDQYIYLSNPADLKALLGTDDETKFLQYTLDDTTYQVDGVNNAYVDITYTFRQGNKVIATYVIPKGQTDGAFTYYNDAGEPILDANGNPVDMSPVLKEDTTYSIHCEVKSTGKVDPNRSVTTESTVEATVFVYKPVITYADSAVKYYSNIGMTEEEYYADNNYQHIAWKGNYRDDDGNIVTGATATVNNNTGMAEIAVKETVDNAETTKYVPVATMSGTRPELKDFTLTYATSYDWAKDTIESGKNLVTGKTDVNVNLTKVEVNGMDITDYTSTVRLKCNVTPNCGYTSEGIKPIKGTDVNDPEFKIHIGDIVGELVVLKKVEDARSEQDGTSVPNKDFRFTILLKDQNDAALNNLSYTIRNSINNVVSDNDVIVVADGKISNGGSINLKAGQYILITGIPDGATYSVTETIAPGFVSVHDGQPNGTITAPNRETEIFTNQYKPEPLTIVKNIVDAQGNIINDVNINDDVFTFRVELPEGNYVHVVSDSESHDFTIPTADGKNFYDVTVTGKGSVTINNVPVYAQYKITEITKPEAYDYGSVNDRTIGENDQTKVETASELSIQGYVPQGGSYVVFKNKYITGNLVIDKTINGLNTGYDANAGDDPFTVMVSLPAGTYKVNNEDVVFNGGEQELAQKLTADSNIVISSIPRGASYTVGEVTTKLPVGYSANGVSYENCEGTITAISDAVATIDNTYRTGTLEITKTVVNNFISSDVYAFKLKLPAGEFNYSVVNANGQAQHLSYQGSTQRATGTVSNGEFIYLRNGWKVTISGIPAGWQYSVSEIQREAYVTTATGDSGTIDANATSTAAFTNTHKIGNLSVTKKVEGANVDPAEKFKFTVTASYTGIANREFDVEVTPVGSSNQTKITFSEASVATFYIGHNQKFTIKGLPAGATYSVAETLETDYDQNIFQNENFVVNTPVINDNGTASIIDADKTDEVAFTNTYLDENLTIKKSVQDANGGTNLTEHEKDIEFVFTVTLTAPANVTLSNTYQYEKGSFIAEEGEDAGSGEAAQVTEGELSFTNGVANVSLKHGEYITVKDLPTGTYYDVVETEDGDFDTTMTGDFGMISKGTLSVAEFINKHKFGYLQISKTVDSKGFALPEYVDSTFKFKIILPDGEYKYTKNGGTIKYPLEKKDGYYEVELQHGEFVSIAVPPETVYTVTELVPAGFVCTSNSDRNNGTPSVIDAARTDYIDFTNTYTPASLQIIKTIVDENGNVIASGNSNAPSADSNVTDDVFTFKVNITNLREGSYPVEKTDNVSSPSINDSNYFRSDGNDNTMHTITITGAGNATINGIPISADTQFSVYEDTASLQGKKGYTEHSVSIDGASASGQVATGVLDFNHQVVTVEVKNVYVTRDLNIKKKVVDKNGDEINDANIANNRFKVNVAGIPDGWYNVEVKDANGTTTTSTMNFTGTSHDFYIYGANEFTIKNVPIDTEYTVTEYTDADNMPTGFEFKEYSGNTNTGKIETSDTSPVTVTITNTYNRGSLGIKKTITNTDFRNDEFTFTITLKDKNGNNLPGAYPWKLNGTDQTSTISNGSVIKLKHNDIALIENLPEGAKYVVTETKDSDYTTDPSDYTLDGTIVKDATQTAEFKNTHKTGGLVVSKTVDNVTSTQQFKFIIEVTFEDDPLKNGTYGGVEFTNGVAAIYLGHGESKIISGLPVGAEVTVTEEVYEAFDTTPAKVETEIPETGNATAEFTNTHKLGDLKISKTVVPVEGFDLSYGMVDHTQVEFKFEVTLTKPSNVTLDGTYKYTKGSGTEKTDLTFTNNKATVNLKHGEYITIEGLPIGTGYNVTELGVVSGETMIAANDTKFAYEVSKTGDSGTISSTTSEAAFTNTIKPASLTIKKEVVMPAGMATDATTEFKFEVVLKDHNGDPMADREFPISGIDGKTSINSGDVIHLKHNQMVTISQMLPGMKFTVTEQNIPLGYVCSNSHAANTVASGNLDAGETENVVYTNTYHPEHLKITKYVVDAEGNIISNDNNINDDVFTFNVTLPAGEYKLSGNDDFISDGEHPNVITLKNGETFVINSIPYNAPYKVEEVGIPNGYTLVSPEGSEDSTIPLGGAEVVFSNAYNTGELDITKEVVGNLAPKDTEVFTFKVNFYTDSSMVNKQDGTFSYTIGDGAAVEISDDGEISLKHGETAKITGIPTGTYYKVEEVLTEKQDDDYELTSETGDTGTIGSTVSKAEFVNTHRYGSLKITKVFEDGVTPADGETFLFNVTGPNGYKTKIVIARSGSVTIDMLLIGEYTVTEDDSWSWRYSSSSDPATGKVTVTSTEIGEITFTNDLTNDKWLDGNTSAENIFDGKGGKAPSSNSK